MSKSFLNLYDTVGLCFDFVVVIACYLLYQFKVLRGGGKKKQHGDKLETYKD